MITCQKYHIILREKGQEGKQKAVMTDQKGAAGRLVGALQKNECRHGHDVEHMRCKTLTGMHGMFDEQARERGIHIMWISHDLCDPRGFTRQAIRDQVNAYMCTVMRGEPPDPFLEKLYNRLEHRQYI